MMTRSTKKMIYTALALLLIGANCNAQSIGGVDGPIKECPLSKSTIYLLSKNESITNAFRRDIYFQTDVKQPDNDEILEDYLCLTRLLSVRAEHKSLSDLYSINNLQILSGYQQLYDTNKKMSELAYPYEISVFIASEASMSGGNKTIKDIISYGRKGRQAGDALFEMFPSIELWSEQIKRAMSNIQSLEAGAFGETDLESVNGKDRDLAIIRIYTSMLIIPYLDVYVSIFADQGYLKEIAPDFYLELANKHLEKLSR